MHPAVKRILQETKRILENSGSWTQGVYARNQQQGCSVDISSPSAVCFCLDGALQKAANWDYLHHKDDPFDFSYSEARAVLKGLLPHGYESHIYWNDAPDRTHQEVIDLLDRAIA